MFTPGSAVVVLLSRVPRAVWLTLATVLALGGLGWQYQRLLTQRYTLGYVTARTEILEQAATLVSVADERARVARGHTDTVVQRVTVRVARVDTLLARIHDTVLVQLPTVVQESLGACAALSAACGQVRALLVAERAAADSLGAYRRTVEVGLRDSARGLAKRPTRKRLWLTAAGVAVGGYVVGNKQ